MKAVDVLCIGVASYDLYYQIDRHPAKDEKMNAQSFIECGGGPAANASYSAAHLGVTSAFIGYLGKDYYGRQHLQELRKAGVNVSGITLGERPTPLSVILIKPDGQRTLVNYRDRRAILQNSDIKPKYFKPKVILVDGHEPDISLKILASNKNTTTILDAGSIHSGTKLLIDKVDYLICSEKFAVDYTGKSNPQKAIEKLFTHAPNVIITLGEKGLVWKNQSSQGRLQAFAVDTIDSTAAGDVFHGAFAASIVKKLDFKYSLKYSSAAAALCCTKIGGRTGAPTETEINRLMNLQNLEFDNL